MAGALVPSAAWTASPTEAEYAAMASASAATVYPRDGARCAALARLNAALTPTASPVVYRGRVYYTPDDWIVRGE